MTVVVAVCATSVEPSGGVAVNVIVYPTPPLANSTSVVAFVESANVADGVDVQP